MNKLYLLSHIFILSLIANFAPITIAETAPAAAKEVVVYSARKSHLIQPLFDAYTKKTGINIVAHTDKAAALLARLKAEGENTPADILMTVDAGNLWHAAQPYRLNSGADPSILVGVDSEKLNNNIPAHLRDPDNKWFGLSVRARTIVYHQARVKPAELSTYEALAEGQWKGRLCLRTSKKVYNQSLVAMMLARLGEGKTNQVVRGWVSNMNHDNSRIFSSDTKLMQAMLAGEKCDVGIVNTYYYGRLQKKDPNIKLALFWPNQADRGVHVNISGAGIIRYSKNKKAAIALLEWLSSAEAQQKLASLNFEYPVNEAVIKDPIVASWGTFKADSLNVAEAGRLQVTAVKLMDKAKYR